MKTANLMIKTLLAASALTSTAYAEMPFAEGAYVGRLNKDVNVHMMVRKIPGRDSSFMAVIFKPNGKNQDACIYMVDPANPNDPSSYAMNPLIVTPDGEIGMNTAVPSLEMHLLNTSDPKNPEFKITSANSRNTYCIQGSINFKGTDSRFKWDRAIIPGEYGARGHGKIASVTQMNVAIDDASLNASVLFETPRRGLLPFPTGKYMAREKAPGFFTLKRSELGEGLQRDEEKVPRRIGFAATTCWGTRLYLINPSDHTDIIPLNAIDDLVSNPSK